jgi:Ribosomal RNA adenine dimethylase
VVRLGQNFLADPNLLAAIVRDAGVGPDDVVLEVGAGAGVLTERLAPRVAHLHTVEIDRGLEPALAEVAALPNVTLHWGDAVKIDFSELDPAPDAMVANLPYSVATPVILKTIAELPSLRTWTVMVQLEIAERLRAKSGNRTYGAPSAVVQLACEVELIRKVAPASTRRSCACGGSVRAPMRRPGTSSAPPSPTAAKRWRARWSWSGCAASPSHEPPPARPWSSSALRRAPAPSSSRRRTSPRCRRRCTGRLPEPDRGKP